MKNWHQLKKEEVLSELKTYLAGISPKEAEDRRNIYGKNLLPKRKRITLAQIILHQFLSPLIYVLLAAAIFSLVLKEYSDAGFIFLILVINAFIGAFQESKAESKASALQDLIKIRARVKREGREMTINSEDLVPGDIVLVESGNKVPADIRVLKSNNLAAEEAILTGESMAVLKNEEPLEQSETVIAERFNMMYAGTTITSGRGMGVVVATGIHTEIGKISTSLKVLETGKAPLVERMEVFARKISMITLFACFFLSVIGYLNGIPLSEIFFFVVAVAVSAIPEGLPIAMTVALSIGTSRMAKRNVIVRKLTAVEGLGSCTLIATDKTGTLTVDQQTVKIIVLNDVRKFLVTGEGYTGEGNIHDGEGEIVKTGDVHLLDKLIEAVTVCNEGVLRKENEKWIVTGDPIDIAFLSLSYKACSSPDEVLQRIEKIKEIPFESGRQFSAVYYRNANGLQIAVKGAFEKIAESVTGVYKNSMLEEAEKLAENGYRVIAVGGGVVGEVYPEGIPEVELFGIVALIDPLRPEAKDAVALCHKAGVEVAMITGDHPSTAFSIAKEVGIASEKEELITGIELAKAYNMGGNSFTELLKRIRVFSRVSPQQKYQIVEGFRSLGHFIAVTGDGVNDAPALKSANIGIAMGYGTDVAKDTASIIVSDNNFASIAAGVEEGRSTYSNLRKIIYLLISTGAAELLMIALSLVFQLPLPFLPVQLLWLNLVTNGIQDVALAFEPGDASEMAHPPRKPSETVFDKLMIKQTLLSAVTISLVTFGLWYHLLSNLHWEEATARNAILLLMVLLQNFHVLNCRSETKSIFKLPLWKNPVLTIGILAAQGIHILAMHIPFMQNLLALSPIPLMDWVKLFATASIILFAMEIFKFFRSRQT
ncbi:MAG: HAD-IC family P-type ATPase [Anditalea sp.]